MRPINYDQTCYRIDGKPVYLNSGEFHYFRVPRADWRARMKLFKQAGGNCLATYVPWVVHEPVEGQFVFGAEGFNDLEGFLQTAAEAGLYVIARPGPYQYSELLYAGLPHWLCQNYPEILTRDIQGNTLHFMSVSYLHPLFLEKAKRWYDAVCPILARYTVQNGGPIAFTQVDNELIGIHTWFGSLDYHPVTMGFGKENGRYTLFLERRYGEVEALNQVYRTAYAAFAEVPPPAMTGEQTIPESRRRKDYFEFYLETITEYVQTLSAWLRQHGVRTPIIHNSASWTMNSLFKGTVQSMGEGFVLGSDHYFNLDQTWAQNNPTPQYARNIFYSLEMLRLMGYPPTIYELPGGSLSDFPPVTPSDAKTCYLTNAALGMKGHNYYILTGGVNPNGIGSTTDIYDYGAGIGANGEVRPLFEAQKEYADLFSQYPWLPEAEREGDFRIALDWESTRAEYYWKDRGSLLLSSPEAWKSLVQGPLTTAFCASLSPVFCDLERQDWLKDTSTPVLVASSSVLSQRKQENIVRFLQNGGKVLLAPCLPTLDENWEPCTTLVDFLGKPSLRGGGKLPTRLRIGSLPNVYNNGEAFFFENLPAGSEVLGVDENSQSIVCFSQKFPGGGEFVGLGLRWMHAMREHETMLSELLSRLGLSQKVLCSNPNVWTSLRTAGDHSLLFLMNLFSSPMDVNVQCKPSWSGKMLDGGAHHLPPMTVKSIRFQR